MRTTRWIFAIFAAGLVGLTGCSQQQTVSEDVSPVVEQRFTLAPATIPVTMGPLTGELSELSVTRRVDGATGETIYAPVLTGTLVLRNVSEDQAVRLIGGEVTYLGEGRAAIALDTSRQDAAFTFPSYVVERLDPGQEMRHTLDVPFPETAFDGGLAELRLGLDYMPLPYREGTATVAVSVDARS